MTLFVVDVESDGPVPGPYSMVSFGVVAIDKKTWTPSKTFFGQVKPISEKWIPEALAISNVTREQHLQYNNPETVMNELTLWLKENAKGRPKFVSDNPAFDWQFMNYYFHVYTGSNPFGHSARRIGDFYAGLQKDFFSRADWKSLKQTPHTHNPVDDAMGNAEALCHMIKVLSKN